MLACVGVAVLQVVCTHDTGRGELWSVTVLGPLTRLIGGVAARCRSLCWLGGWCGLALKVVLVG